jgi:hypothetical protein
MAGTAGPPEIRKKWSDRFAHRVRLLDGNAGLAATTNFLGWTPEQETAWNRMKAILSTGTNPFLSPVQEPVVSASFDDLHPPSTFLVSLDVAADGWSADAKAFFGTGGAIGPRGANGPLDGALDAGSALLLERHFQLRPGESRTLFFLSPHRCRARPLGREVPPESGTLLDRFVGAMARPGNAIPYAVRAVGRTRN